MDQLNYWNKDFGYPSLRRVDTVLSFWRCFQFYQLFVNSNKKTLRRFDLHFQTWTYFPIVVCNCLSGNQFWPALFHREIMARTDWIFWKFCQACVDHLQDVSWKLDYPKSFIFTWLLFKGYDWSVVTTVKSIRILSIASIPWITKITRVILHNFSFLYIYSWSFIFHNFF